ncbi:MAG: hypothetical protein WBP02_04025 [Gammaproteobacteria bacterium]
MTNQPSASCSGHGTLRYSIWEKVYPELALVDDPIQNAKIKIEKQLAGTVHDIKDDLVGIYSFLESCGLYLGDNYVHVRDLIKHS